jgi:hypothetical protein
VTEGALEVIDIGRIEMGSHPYWYVVKHKPEIDSALQELRQREFQAGRYNRVLRYLRFPLSPNSPAPGAKHATIAEALEDAEAEGTRSILDLERVSDEPEPGAVTALNDDALLRLFGTTRPTRQMVESRPQEGLGARGQGIYIILYKDDRPDEIFFAGRSFD